MPGRYNFQSRFGRPERGWFSIGSLEVNTTVGIVALGAIGMVASYVPDLVRLVALNRNALAGFQIWRLVTYVLPNEPNFWTLIMLLMVYMFGSQLENQIGREGMLRLVVALTVVPAVVFAVLAVAVGSSSGFVGLDVVELGLLVAFAAQFPWVRFFFGIPAPIMVGIFVLLRILSTGGSLPALALVLTTVALAVFGLRAMGYAGDVHQIPRLSIPGLTPAGSSHQSKPNRSSGTKGSSRRRKKKSARDDSSLRVVPSPPTRSSQPPAEIDAILDQINESGIGSLTPEQRATLDDYSRRLRDDKDR